MISFGVKKLKITIKKSVMHINHQILIKKSSISYLSCKNIIDISVLRERRMVWNLFSNSAQYEEPIQSLFE